MARCNSCNKFVSYDTEVDPDVQLEAEGRQLTGSITRDLACGECGDVLKSTTFELELDMDENVPELCPKAEDGEHQWEIDHDISSSVRTDGKGRGAKTFYGASGTVNLTCGQCELVTELAVDAELQASSFEEC